MQSGELVPAAMRMIHDALKPIIKAGRPLERIKLKVCPMSRIAEKSFIETDYGRLRIEAGQYVPKGVSYLIEDSTSKQGRGFAWVSRRNE